MSELQLRGVCSTAQDMAEACDRLIGAARVSSEPKDLGSLLALRYATDRDASSPFTDPCSANYLRGDCLRLGLC